MKKFSMIFITLMMLFALVFLGCNSPVDPGGGPGDDEDPPLVVDPLETWIWEAGDSDTVPERNKTAFVMNGLDAIVRSGNVSLDSNGNLVLNNGRLSIGSKSDTDTSSTVYDRNGQLNLSEEFKVTITYISSVDSDTGEDADKGNFQIFIHNNSTTANDSVVKRLNSTAGSRPYSARPDVTGGQVELTVDPVARFDDPDSNLDSLKTSFIMLRTEGNVSLTISSIKIEPVGAPLPQYDPVESVTIASADDVDEIEVGDTLQFTATVLPATADQAVTWSVTNGTGTATIDTAGLLTGTGAGDVTVKAIGAGDVASDPFTVTINPPAVPVTAVNITSTVTEVAKGEKITLTAEVLPNTANQTVTWSVVLKEGGGNADTVATINANSGELTGVSVGTVTVTATSVADSSKFANVDIEVTGFVYVAPTTDTNKLSTYMAIFGDGGELVFTDSSDYLVWGDYFTLIPGNSRELTIAPSTDSAGYAEDFDYQLKFGGASDANRRLIKINLVQNAKVSFLTSQNADYNATALRSAILMTAPSPYNTDNKIVTFTEKGKLETQSRMLAAGDYYLAAAGNDYVVLDIIVDEAGYDLTPGAPATIEISGAPTLNMSAGSTTLTAKVYDENALEVVNPTITWSVVLAEGGGNADAVATISDGILTAVGAGNVVVTARVGEVTSEGFNVTVINDTVAINWAAESAYKLDLSKASGDWERNAYASTLGTGVVSDGFDLQLLNNGLKFLPAGCMEPGGQGRVLTTEKSDGTPILIQGPFKIAVGIATRSNKPSKAELAMSTATGTLLKSFVTTAVSSVDVQTFEYKGTDEVQLNFAPSYSADSAGEETGRLHLYSIEIYLPEEE